MAANWRSRIKALREEYSLSQAELGRRAGVSSDSIGGYESGTKRPRRAVLSRIAKAFGLDAAETDALLTGAGYGAEATAELEAFAARRSSLSTLQRQMRAYSWPSLIGNERQEVVGWNDPAEWVAELSFSSDLPEKEQRNYLRIAVLPHFRARVLNWDHVLTTLIAMNKLDAMDINRPESESAYFNAQVQTILRDHSEIVPHLFELWEKTPEMQRGGRLHYFPVWKVSDGTVLRFHVVQSSWNDYDALWASEWHPADARTWEWLEQRATAESMARQSTDLSTDHADSSRDEADEPSPSAASLLRLALRSTGITQQELADLSGVSFGAISGYVRDRRRPRRETLLHMTRAMELDAALTNAILAALEMPPEPSDWALALAGEPRRTPTKRWNTALFDSWPRERRQRDIARHTWPCLLVDQQARITNWNPVAVVVFGLDWGRSLPAPYLTNFVGFIVSAYTQARLTNWHEVVAVVLAPMLRPYLVEEMPMPPALRSTLEAVMQDSPDLFTRLTDAWQKSPPDDFGIRIVAPLEWLASDGNLLRFNTTITVWSAFDDVWAVDLHPADADTWRWLGEPNAERMDVPLW